MWGDESDGSLPFSYAARKIEASVRSAPDLKDVATTTIDLRETEAEAYFEAIKEFRPSLVAASTYVWSIDLFCEVAALVRAWDPSVRFVMGGPSARPSVLGLEPYADRAPAIDAVVKGEGEEVIRRLVRDHLDEDWREKVPGMLVRHPLGYRHSGDLERPVLDDYASPYQIGTIPRADHGYLETFRGCPISCAFCQWGEERADRIYSTEYLADHLRGFADTGVTAVHVLDAAFNLSTRAFRNLAAAEAEAKILCDRKVIGHVYPSYLKDFHLDLLSSFGRAELDVGIQSFDRQVLKDLGRPFDPDRFERMLEVLAGNFPLDLEIIMGLPGDDPASFRRTFERLIEYPAKVRVFWCLALPDALLERADEYDIDFDPITFGVRSCRGWTEEGLRSEWEHVRKVAEQMYRTEMGSNWVEFRTASEEARHRRGEMKAWRLASAHRARLSRAIDEAAMGYSLAEAERGKAGVILHLAGGEGPVVLQASVANPGERSFVELGGIAYSHRGELARGDASKLRLFIERVHGDVGTVARSVAGEVA